VLFRSIPTSEAELWELVVDVNVEKEAIQSGETLVISGTIVDHAYKPMRSVEVFIRAGSDTTKAFTNPEGEFRGEIKDFQRIPGIYKVNVIASWYGMTGLTSTEFRVNGDVTQVSALQEKLSTDEARKYLSSNESDFEKNPIGQTLFKYYHELLDELIQEQKESREPNVEQIYLEQQRKIAEDLRNQAIEFYNPGAGIYEGYQREQYLASLNPEIRELVATQLDFTKNIFEEAQKSRDEILANGGTYEEARQTYLDMISIPKEVLEQFNEEQLEESTENSQASEENSDP
jgi:hypothetical protein